MLGVSLGLSGIYALLSFVRAEWTIQGGIGASTTTVVSGTQTTYPWLDLLDDLADLLHGFAPPLLALVLLARYPGGRGFGVGFDLRRIRRESLQGVGFLALIGIPGLALVYFAHRAGVNASLDVVNFPDVWYRVPYLLLSAFQNGLAEEIVVVAFMLTRLRQAGWTKERALERVGAAARQLPPVPGHRRVRRQLGDGPDLRLVVPAHQPRACRSSSRTSCSTRSASSATST